MSEQKKDTPAEGVECYQCGRGGDGNKRLVLEVNALHQRLAHMTRCLDEATKANGIRSNPDRAERWIQAAVSGQPLRRKDD